MPSDEHTFKLLRELEALPAPQSPNEEIVPTGERECPICKQRMESFEEQGVIIEACEEHGIWLDRGELEAILHRVRSRDRLSRDMAIRNAIKSERKAAQMWCAWTIAFD